IPPGIVEADFDPNDDTSSDDDDFENVEYEVNAVDQEKEFDLEDILQNPRLNSTPDRVLESPSPFPIPVMDSDSFLEES
ncbi:hypothetical protein Tco_0555171, partial [Tanacetum coccineum]